MGHERLTALRAREQAGVGVDQGNPQRLLVEVEVLLSQPAVGEAHLTVVRGEDDERVVQHATASQRVQDLLEIEI